MNDSLRHSLQYKLGAIVLGVTILALALFGALLLEHVERTEFAQESRQLLETAQGVSGLLAVNHQLLTLAAESHFESFQAMLPGPVVADATRPMQLGGRDVARLTIGGRVVETGFEPVEIFTRDNADHVATVFVRHGDDFLRVATSLRDAGGDRAVGTLLGKDHPASRKLLAGEDYVGKADLLGRHYMTRYRPLRDASGRTVGALFVGIELTKTLALLRDEIKAIRIGRTGYVYVLDARPGPGDGRLLVHATHEGHNAFDVVEPQTRDALARALAGDGGAIARYRVPDRAGVVKERIAAIAFSPEWQWAIGASADYEEFTEQRVRMQYAVFGALLVAALAIIAALKIAIRRLILAPLLDMHATLQASEERFRTLVTSSHDLIYTVDTAGRLATVFDKECILLGPASAPPVGQPVQTLLGADPKHEDAHARALAGEHVVYEWSADGPGRRAELQSSLSPMQDERGGVTGLVCIARDISERRRAEELASYLAHHDPLTGLPNRTLMHDRLQHAIRQAERSRRVVGLLFVDLDHFKAVNDEHGHAVGDELLKAIAERLQVAVRQGDTVARIGGDEFVVVVGDAHARGDLIHVAEKLLDAFGQPFALSSGPLRMSASIGISSYPTDATDAASLLKRADAAMYEAKKAGRSNYHCDGATT